jgi:alkylation response protein AidB-like acyl-CoA dehydrogenase
MRFAFTDDQLAFRDALRDLLARECPPSVVRDAWTNETGRTKGVWAQLGEMGVLGSMAPEEAGGLGFTEEDLVLLLE